MNLAGLGTANELLRSELFSESVPVAIVQNSDCHCTLT
jgi:hypothetical protein